MEFYNSRHVVARKDYKCDLCGGLISKGEKYQRVAGKYDGEFFDDKFHLTCQNIINTYCHENNDHEYCEDYIVDWLHDKHCYDCENYEDNECEVNILLCSKIRSCYEIKSSNGGNV
ncbi:MAG: hypothetical protein IJZ79_03585 [Bacilli bacterium]|nr:hypothetical protein [Bacilli bacterium]MBQ8218811.1 hypothetical protein [Bacilli bacterium]